MKTDPQNNCGAALDALLSRMESAEFTPAALEAVCKEFPDCSQELRSTYAMWQEMDVLAVPEPSPAMHAGFYQMLGEFTAETAQPKAGLRFDWWTWNGFSLKWAVLAGVFVLGVLSGNFFRPIRSGPGLPETAGQEHRQLEESYVMLTSSESATDRLKGTQLARQMERPDEKIIEALNQTLLHDSNVNVRLSAIETMIHFTDNPRVREHLIRAIPFQSDPLVQLALAEVMLALKDKRAVEQIKRLLQRGDVEVEVKMQLEETIETLL